MRLLWSLPVGEPHNPVSWWAIDAARQFAGEVLGVCDPLDTRLLQCGNIFEVCGQERYHLRLADAPVRRWEVWSDQ